MNGQIKPRPCIGVRDGQFCLRPSVANVTTLSPTGRASTLPLCRVCTLHALLDTRPRSHMILEVNPRPEFP